ncbi:hypothetical protein NHQ30_004415 [Ciborinia camelliae]|nr:hypothetical protein NHQ30_004415 [Ciborinia camelliae]
METPFTTGAGTTTVMATPTMAQSYPQKHAVLKFPNRQSGLKFSKAENSSSKSNSSGDSNSSGVNTPATATSLANRLATLKDAQEKASGAAHVMVNFKWDPTPIDTLPMPGFYTILIERNESYMALDFQWVERQRKLYEKVFGKDSLKKEDMAGLPSATLRDVDMEIFGMFVFWTQIRGSKLLQYEEIFINAQICTREDRFNAIGTMMDLLFFAERFSLDEFQDEVLRLFIDTCKEDESPLNIIHAQQCHENTSRNSKTRAFFIDFIAFIIQEIKTAGHWKDKEAALNCDLSSCSPEDLAGLLDMLKGRSIRTSDGHLLDPRQAPKCTYHQHGPKKACPHKCFLLGLVGVVSSWFVIKCKKIKMQRK